MWQAMILNRISKKDTRIGSSKTIIHFANRKHAKQALYNKKKLSQLENLTRMNESLAYQGRKLKHNELVNACYTRDGIVTAKINERSKAIRIHHMNNLLKLFLNFDFEDEPSHDTSPDVSGQSM